MKPLISARVTETDNVGDAVCSPLQYFSFDGYARSFHDLRCLPPDGPVIFGGGGLLHPKLDAIIEAEVVAHRRQVILWGIGTNYHGDDPSPPEPGWLPECALAGLRDWRGIFENSNAVYVPCPSCMNCEFNRHRQATEQIVIYEHQDFPIVIPGQDFIRRMNNRGDQFSFRGALDFIGSAETVITNTFHGLYWSLLLGRKAVCWKPFSSRFHHFKPPVRFCDEGNWRQAVAGSIAALWYLKDCRQRNVEFAGMVRRQLALNHVFHEER